MTRSNMPLILPRLCWRGFCGIAIAFAICTVQVRAQPSGATLLPQAKAQTAGTPTTPRTAAPSSTKPAWNELTPAQQQALKPLGANWPVMSDAQKRKWIALSANYPRLPPEEQTKLHSRMTGWVALSPNQRSEARLNFAEARKLPPDEKKAKWQAYQALSAEERQKLAASAESKPKGAAPAVKPIPAKKLATVTPPLHTAASPGGAVHHTPKIAVLPHQVDGNTLLPQHVPVPDSSEHR